MESSPLLSRLFCSCLQNAKRNWRPAEGAVATAADALSCVVAVACYAATHVMLEASAATLQRVASGESKSTTSEAAASTASFRHLDLSLTAF